LGQPDWFIERLAAQAPRHRVRITQPFYLGKFEVTQGQYQRVMGTNPSQFPGDPDLPVESVSWEDAMVFSRKLEMLPQEQAMAGEYRLPTEAQWEYACRAGSDAAYCFGDSVAALGEYAWYSGNDRRKTHPVGLKKPNAWGLHDMHGGVREWCYDWFGFHYYADSPREDPAGPSSGTERVYRGGSWDGGASGRRSAYRSKFPPHDPHGAFLGFRLTRTLGSSSRE
jgi:formylglycine-generating enzyme required for sulfatase activity